MQKKQKTLIGIGCALIVVLIAILFITTRPISVQPAKNTQWVGVIDSDVVMLSDNNYSWKYDDDNYVEGACSIQEGKDALHSISAFEKKYKQTYADMPKEEMYGFEDEMDLVKKKLKGGDYFLLSENLSKTVSRGQEIDSQNQIYLGRITNENGVRTLALTNILSHDEHTFHEASPQSSETPVFGKDQVDKAIADKNIDASFELPAGYVKKISDSSIVMYGKPGTNDYVTFIIMPDTPITGIADELTNRQKETINGQECYTATERLGGRVLHIIMFEKGGATYKVDITDPDVMTLLKDTLKF